MTSTPFNKSFPSGALRIVQAASLLAVAVALSGCGLHRQRDVAMTSTIPTDYRLRHPITIQERDSRLEFFVGQRRGGLMPEQRDDAIRFAHVWRREATGGLLIDVPRGTPNARAAAETARELRAVLARAGVPARAIAMRSYTPHDPSQLATVRLRYPKMAAQAGPCGLWPEDLGLPHDAQPTMNRPYWNLGCASQRNLAALVDNPTDFVQPRGETEISAPRRQVIVNDYRQGRASAVTFKGMDK